MHKPTEIGDRPPFRHIPKEDSLTIIAGNACAGLLVLDNGPVHALLGNARNPYPIQEAIREVKGDAREASRPVGCTLPFDHPLLDKVFDASNIDNSKIRALHKQPDSQRDYLGGLVFLRGRIVPGIAVDRDIPASMLSPAPSVNGERVQDTVLQVYSPEGNTATEALLRKMIELEALPVMTSANVSGKPEIADRGAGMQFAQDHNLDYAARAEPKRQPAKPRGSYPIVEARHNSSTGQWEMVWIRTGFLARPLLQHLLPDVPVRFDKDCPPPKYPNKVLDIPDIRRHRLRQNVFRLLAKSPTGRDLRLFALEASGVANC